MNSSLVDALLPEVRAKLHEDIIKRMNLIDNEDFSLVAYKTKLELSKRGVDASDEHITNLIFALKQYYAVALLDPLNSHAVSVVVDDPWHMHILDTKAYEKFCANVYGHTLPHVHLNYGDLDRVAQIRTLYGYTVDMLGKMFKHVSAEMYPSPELQPDTKVLVCLHYEVQNVVVRSHATFPVSAQGRSTAFA